VESLPAQGGRKITEFAAAVEVSCKEAVHRRPVRATEQGARRVIRHRSSFYAGIRTLVTARARVDDDD